MTSFGAGTASGSSRTCTLPSSRATRRSRASTTTPGARARRALRARSHPARARAGARGVVGAQAPGHPERARPVRRRGGKDGGEAGNVGATRAAPAAQRRGRRETWCSTERYVRPEPPLTVRRSVCQCVENWAPRTIPSFSDDACLPRMRQLDGRRTCARARHVSGPSYCDRRPPLRPRDRRRPRVD